MYAGCLVLCCYNMEPPLCECSVPLSSSDKWTKFIDIPSVFISSSYRTYTFLLLGVIEQSVLLFMLNNLHKNSQKVQAMQKKTAWKKLQNQRWWPKSGCDGRIMEKFLITTIQANLCCLLQASLGIGTKFTWIVVIKILPLSYHHSHFWASTFDFTTFFMLSFFAWPTPFFTVWLFLCRFHLFL